MSEQTDGGKPKTEDRPQEKKHEQTRHPVRPKAARGGFKRAIALLVLFILIAIGGFGLSAWMMPDLRQRFPLLDHILPAPPPQAGRIATLEGDVASLKATVADLSTQSLDAAAMRRQVDGLAVQLSDLEGRLNELTGGAGMAASESLKGKPASAQLNILAARVAQLEAAVKPLSRNAQFEADAARDRALLRNHASELEKQITSLNDRISALETFAASDRQGSILGLTLAQLRSTIDSGRSFQTSLGLLLDLIPDSSLKNDSPARAAIQALQAHAPEGVATLDQLNQRFARMSSAVLRAAAIPDDANWLGRAWGRLKGLIIIRERGVIKGDSPAAILSRAEVSLSEDDLDGALNNLRSLKGGAGEAAQSWIASAEARQEVDAAIEQLSGLLEEEAIKAPQAATGQDDPAKKGAR